MHAVILKNYNVSGDYIKFKYIYHTYIMYYVLCGCITYSRISRFGDALNEWLASTPR